MCFQKCHDFSVSAEKHQDTLRLLDNKAPIGPNGSQSVIPVRETFDGKKKVSLAATDLSVKHCSVIFLIVIFLTNIVI